jgi:D-glycero-D-manno-heptose 1,7-bisphosphate phosphatase
VIEAEQGTVDSPLAENQVTIFPDVPRALARLTAAGYALAIVTNQPASAKGKTTRDNLERVHDKVLRLVQAEGGRINSSHICFHRAEDGCPCRKPRTGLLQDAFQQNNITQDAESWCVGDGLSDMQAGQAMGLKTAFVARKKTDVMKVLEEQNVRPTLWVNTLQEFVDVLLKDVKEELRG